MGTQRSSYLVICLAVAVTGAGCGQWQHHSRDDYGPAPAPQNPSEMTVSSTAPADGDKGAFLNTQILATFSQPLDAATLGTSTYTLMQGITPVAGAVVAVGSAATFKPAANLMASTAYTVTLGTAVKDLAGNALAVARTWTFTTGTTVDSAPPIVSSTNTNDGATGVATNGIFTATFSKTVDPATVTTATFTVTQGGTPVPGTITVIGNVATFKPSASLAAGTRYTVTIGTGVKDLAGNALSTATTWSFTTGPTADTTPPAVSATSPANGATGVVINRGLTATFDKAIDPATITASTFTLTQGGVPVAGLVSGLGSVATLKPTVNLLASTLYTVTLGTGVKDLSGNPLAAPKSWTFTTGGSLALGPSPVALGTASNFAILTKSGITNVASSAITGDIGTSPITGAAIVGLDCVQVVGKIYEVDPTGPACATTNSVYLTTAIGDLEIAYNDAAGRTTPDATELGAGEIGALTIAPGLYKWGSNVNISTEVKLSGGANDVWIFQIAGDLTEASGIHVTLVGDAQAKNIFWQVAGQVTLGTTAQFSGTILSKTQIALKTGASLSGRALAQTAVTLQSNAVHTP